MMSSLTKRYRVCSSISVHWASLKLMSVSSDLEGKILKRKMLNIPKINSSRSIFNKFFDKNFKKFKKIRKIQKLHILSFCAENIEFVILINAWNRFIPDKIRETFYAFHQFQIDFNIFFLFDFIEFFLIFS